jgi:tRNA(Ile)-lysidine synthase
MTLGAEPIPDLEPGRWCVAVSGGADSVALLRLLHGRGDCRLHAAHLDHELRGKQSTGDARFVAELCTSLAIPVTLAKRSEIESAMTKLPNNPSARYRAARFDLFRQVVRGHHLDGVALAHHADDQAETILHRLTRTSSIEGLCGMRPRSTIAGMAIRRPLLSIRRQSLRGYLQSIGQPWREDASNASPDYLRNRLRQLLANRPELVGSLIGFAHVAEARRKWVKSVTPPLDPLGQAISVNHLAALPLPIAREMARQWLVGIGAPAGSLDRSSIDRLVCMATDAATAGRQDFPGGIRVARRSGRLGRV